MTTVNDLTANAYLKLRDTVAEALAGHPASTYTREYAERLIEAGFIDINKVLGLPQ